MALNDDLARLKNDIAGVKEGLATLQANPPATAPSADAFDTPAEYRLALVEAEASQVAYIREVKSYEDMIPSLTRRTDDLEKELDALRKACAAPLDEAEAAGQAVIAAIEQLQAALEQWDAAGKALVAAGATRIDASAGTRWRVNGLEVNCKVPELFVDEQAFRVTLNNWKMPTT